MLINVFLGNSYNTLLLPINVYFKFTVAEIQRIVKAFEIDAF